MELQKGPSCEGGGKRVPSAAVLVGRGVGGHRGPEGLPVAERGSLDVLLLGCLVVHSIHRGDGTDDGLQGTEVSSSSGFGTPGTPSYTSETVQQAGTDLGLWQEIGAHPHTYHKVRQQI